MKVKVRYFTTLRELAGVSEEELEIKKGSTLVEVIEKVTLKYGEEASKYLFVKTTGEIDPSLQFLINGVSARNLHGLKTKLKAGDIVAIIPSIGGGSLILFPSKNNG